MPQQSLPMRGVWIEMEKIRTVCMAHPSLPMRGVWIEIAAQNSATARYGVTPHAGSVD